MKRSEAPLRRIHEERRKSPGPRRPSAPGPTPLIRIRSTGLRAARALLGRILLASAIAALAAGKVVTAPAVPSMSTDILQQPSPRVLVLFSGDRLSPANILFDEAFRRALSAGPGEPVESSEEFLDEVDFPVRYQDRMAGLLREKYGEHPPDVIVTLGSSSFDLALRIRPPLFPNAPIVFAGLSHDPAGGAREPGVTGAFSSVDLPATLRLAMRLHPRTQRVFVISGKTGPATPDSVRAQFLGADSGVSLHVLQALSLPDLQRALSSLPEHSLVIDLSDLGGDSASWAHREESTRRMAAATNAPIYGVSDPLVGWGLVGAVVTPVDSIGQAAAAMTREILSRSFEDQLPVVRRLEAAPLVDWRQARRWHVHKNQIPAGSILRNESRSFWQQYRLLVTTWGGLFLLQSGLIIALVLQSRRRRRAELEARRRREELAHMTRVATMGELTASLAHEINQPLAAILSNAQAGTRLLANDDFNLDEIREILSDIAADDLRAGEVIRRMRTLLRKGEFRPTELDVNDLVEEVVGLVRGELILQNVVLTLDLTPRLRPVHGDRVQLQQVLLNLMMNALDAMKEVPDGSRRVLVRSTLSDANFVQVSVDDTGAGIPAGDLEKCFEPFVTTKAHGLGLGLSICRSIIQAHGGRIGSKNNSGRGATFWFTLPAVDEKKP